MATEWIWINGEIMPLADARIGVEDRGFQFADGVYEVVRLYNGVPFTLKAHLERLARSAAAIDIPVPLAIADLSVEMRKLVARSGVLEGMIYLQLTRGSSPRNHVIPRGPAPTLLFYARPLPPVQAPGEGEGTKLFSVPDERWQRCWIKSIALLPNILAKSQAVGRGFDEAVFVDDGNVNECSASNLFAVIDERLVTHPVGRKVLPGITRALLLQCAGEMGIGVDERPMPEHEAMAAEELFITSTTREVSWVARWNDLAVGSSRPGPTTIALHRALQDRVRAETSRVKAECAAAQPAK
ncbi:MAG TPA: aminotransferase class IV [Tepidisphaeraceae bacterium]|jgi:D-alanine transaminase|nr:aminotransferase class IV [Tepidisphaeraceae bacterium]